VVDRPRAGPGRAGRLGVWRARPGWRCSRSRPASPPRSRRAAAGCGDSGGSTTGSTAAATAATTASTATAAPATSTAGGGSLPQQTFPGTPLATTVGKTIRLVLPNNPSTGYTWQFLTLPDPTVVKTGEPQDLSAPGAPPGAGGVRIYPFRGLAAGTTRFTVGYVPPGGNKPNVTRSYTIRVR
jgi:predicted secreted protein